MTIRITLNPEVPATPLADEIVFWAAEALAEDMAARVRPWLPNGAQVTISREAVIGRSR